MPTYQYHCDACGHDHEEFQYFSEEPLTKCPVCKKKKLRRLFGTGASIIFKGPGFYETDYRSESYKSAAKKESDATKPADSKSETADSAKSTETKPATPPKKPGATKGKAGTTGKTD